jgi:DnaJ-class molecular chaperone
MPAKKGVKLSEAQVKRLIEQGDFYEALGVSPKASDREILDALRQRRRGYRTLDQEWNEMHTVLTQQRSLYDEARAARDQVCDTIASEFGEVVFDVSPKASVWRQIWEKVSSHPSAAPRRLVKEVWRDMCQQIEKILLVELTTGEVKSGKADRIGHEDVSQCQECQGQAGSSCALSKW